MSGPHDARIVIQAQNGIFISLGERRGPDHDEPPRRRIRGAGDGKKEVSVFKSLVGLLVSGSVLLTSCSGGRGRSIGNESQKSVFWGSLEPGPYQAGFALMEREDPSRRFPGTATTHPGDRKIRIYVWYPARASSRPFLQFKDYVRLANDDFPPVKNSVKRAGLSLPVALAKGLKADQIQPLLESRARAVREAVPSPGTFPVLIFGQGLYFESPLSNFVLCEFLASHGYVVATSPLYGDPLSIGEPQHRRPGNSSPGHGVCSRPGESDEIRRSRKNRRDRI